MQTEGELEGGARLTRSIEEFREEGDADHAPALRRGLEWLAASQSGRDRNLDRSCSAKGGLLINGSTTSSRSLLG